MKIEVIYSDEDLIAVNKPPGFPVHGGPNVRGKTLVDFLLEKFPEISSVGDDPALRPGIVHRLDKDTSGVMVVARNQKSFEQLKNLFKSRQVEKTYWAIVCGKPKKLSGMISYPIGRLVKNPLKRGICPTPSVGQVCPTLGVGHRIRGAREAITGYKVLKAGEKYSLLELKPKTGRMHQLRVHMKAIGHPVVCDKMYGGKNVCCPAFAESDSATAGRPVGAGRQLLHAKSLSFSFSEGSKFYFEVDPPEDFVSVMREVGLQ